jgi:hypothetical protein
MASIKTEAEVGGDPTGTALQLTRSVAGFGRLAVAFDPTGHGQVELAKGSEGSVES